MRTIAVMNQKGGVGKTTTSVNLSAALARTGKRVCVIDLDPQAHSSLHLGVEALSETPTIFDIFTGEVEFAAVRQMAAPNLWVVPSSIDLAAAELQLAKVEDRETIVRDAMQRWQAVERYDFVLFDCPPSLGVLTINALSAVKEVFIPLQPHFFALQGLSKLFETTALITRRLNRDLRVTGVVMCLYETGTRLASDVTDDLAAFLSGSDPETPWANARIFDTRIRRNIKLAEAPGFGQSVLEYAPNCPGARDYLTLAEEVTAMEAGITAPQLARAA